MKTVITSLLVLNHHARLFGPVLPWVSLLLPEKHKECFIIFHPSQTLVRGKGALLIIMLGQQASMGTVLGKPGCTSPYPRAMVEMHLDCLLKPTQVDYGKVEQTVHRYIIDEKLGFTSLPLFVRLPAVEKCWVSG